MGTGLRAALAALLLTTLGGCVRARLEQEYRKPWSRETKVAEDAAWTVETCAMGAVAIGTLGILNPFEKDGTSIDSWSPSFFDEDEDEDLDDLIPSRPSRSRPAAPAATPTTRRVRGSRRAEGGRRRVRGERSGPR
jgi:hypothetical protein